MVGGSRCGRLSEYNLARSVSKDTGWVVRIFLLSLLALFASAAEAQTTPPADTNVVLQVSVANGPQKFRIGETISLVLSFSSKIKNRYSVNTASMDRSGRMDVEHYNISPSEDVVDPLLGHQSGFGGGIMSFRFLTEEPWTLPRNLNEWVRFLRPGKYRLSVTSNRATVKDPSASMGSTPVSVRSNEIELTIVPATRAWETTVFQDAIAALNHAEPANPQEFDQYYKAKRQALDTLRFLGTPEAERELAKRFVRERVGSLDSVCMLGLLSAPDPHVAVLAMQEELRNPEHPIEQNFLYTLRTLESDPADKGAHWREDQQRVFEELVGALPLKRGAALSVSLGTAVNEAWNSDSIPKQATDKLVQQLIAMFDQLPLEQQSMLLTYRWSKVASPAMLPILRRYAEWNPAFKTVGEPGAYESLQLSASALRHWYELDPAGARLAIIREIVRPVPRFDSRVLGILPDKVLPEVDGPLLEHLAENDGCDQMSRIASLIARYATVAILPQVLVKLDPMLGRYGCDIQGGLLAYVLRVDPAAAKPRIEKAIADRGEGTIPSRHMLFQSISEKYYDPVLEEIATRSLDDPDLEVAMTAATLLGKFGSPKAEAALLRRFESWAAKWKGREAELNPSMAEMRRDYELGMGTNLAIALTTGKSWLTDWARLQRLAQLTEVKRLREQIIDRDLRIWSSPPFTISFENTFDPPRFEALVAQYEVSSMGDLEERVAQFPAATSFMLILPHNPTTENEKSTMELREFLSKKGFIVAGEKPAY
jgi:hypothetical protein